MKKFTKRLTMIVAILLSLVLLTSSIVSTTLAKYVVKKSVTTTAQLQKFGLDVTLDLNNTLEGSADIKNTGDSATITISDFKLKPGDNYKDAITASITGNPTVTANVTIAVDVTCTDANFKAEAAKFNAINGFDKDRIYTPIGFYVGGSISAISPYTYYDYASNVTNKLETEIEKAIETEIKSAIGNKITAMDSTPDGTIIGKIAPNAQSGYNVGINGIGIGFAWLETDADATNGHYEIGTYIADKEPTYTITYTIKVEQAS